MKRNYLTLSILLGMMFCSSLILGQNEQAIQKIQSVTQVQALQAMSIISKQKAVDEIQQAMVVAKQRGMSRVYRGENYYMELQGLDDAGNPYYYITNNANAAESIGTNEIHPSGNTGLNLDGNGMTVGEWDGGAVLFTHQEFNNEGSSRVVVKDGDSDFKDHATHVAGTMIGGGVKSKAKGMSYRAKLHSYNWNYDKSEMAKEAGNGLLLSNHSYGISAGWVFRSYGWMWYGDKDISEKEDWKFGFYDSRAVGFDKIAYNAPKYLICKAAGNDRGDGYANEDDRDGHERDGGEDGYDCIASIGTAKNVLTVGATMDVVGGYSGPASVLMTSFSGWGPTDDGRIKPDVCGNGYQLYSSVAINPETGNKDSKAYKFMSGTSMATPNVTGSLLLLQQYYDRLYNDFMYASCLKALVIHTADECGSYDGPDYMYGWGLVNIPRAASIISNKGNKSMIDYETIQDGEEYTKIVKASGSESLVVTVVWADVPGTPVESQLNPRDIMLVNDLDVVVHKKGETSKKYYPWKLDVNNPSKAATRGINSVDNVEKIEIPNPSSGEYVITITHKGSLKNGKQSFGLVVSGLGNGGVVEPLVAPSGLKSEAITKISATLSWNSVSGANSYEVQYRKVGDYAWTILTSLSSNLVVSNLDSGTSYEWRVRAVKGSRKSVYSDVKTFETVKDDSGSSSLEYCESKGKTYTSEWISKITVGTLTNSSGSLDYSNFTKKVAYLEQGKEYTIELTPGYKSSSFSESWSIFIDLNQDGDFEDNGEIVFTSLNKKDVISGSFTLPSSSKIGRTRMRISMKFGSEAPAPCEEIPFGEVEDYSVEITEGSALPPVPTPSVPEGLSVSNITQNEALLSWGSVSEATSYTVQIREKYTYSWTTLTSTESSLQIQGLKASSDYEWEVRSENGDKYSSYSTRNSFTTLSEVVTPDPTPTPSTYCSSKGKTYSSEWISQVKIGSFVNSSTGSGYSDFTSKVVEVSRGNSISVNLTPGYSGSSFTESWAIYIDLNQDGDFDDSGEKIFTSLNKKDAVSGTLTIPESAKSGNTRMRISMKYGKYAASACGDFSYGEVEDYTVSIKGTEGYSTYLISNSPELQKSLTIPHFLSPNGDGINDTWAVKGLAVSNEVFIYNIYGVLVYRQSDYMLDGVGFDGANLSSGSYYYVIKRDGYEDLNGYFYLSR